MGTPSRSPLRGFNHNVKHGSRVFHVQTEDSGVERPHLFSHLYYQGLIIASARTDYTDLVEQPGHETAVRKMMQEQHKKLMKELRHGVFDAKIAELLGTPDAPPLAEPEETPQADRSEPSQATVEAPPSAADAAPPAAAATRTGSQKRAPDPKVIEGDKPKATGTHDHRLVADSPTSKPSPLQLQSVEGGLEAQLDDVPDAFADATESPTDHDIARPNATPETPAGPAPVTDPQPTLEERTEVVPVWMAPERSVDSRAARRAPIIPVASEVFSPPPLSAKGALGIEDALERAGTVERSSSSYDGEPTIVQQRPGLLDSALHELARSPARTSGTDRRAKAVADHAPAEEKAFGSSPTEAARSSRPAARDDITEEVPIPPGSGTQRSVEERTAVTARARQSGVYALPQWARAPSSHQQGRATAPIAARKSQPRIIAGSHQGSTPQRYVAPSARAGVRSRPPQQEQRRRQTGSYAAVSDSPPARAHGASPETPHAPSARRAAGSGVYEINIKGVQAVRDGHSASGGSPAVIARQAVIIDRNTSAPASNTKASTQSRPQARAVAERGTSSGISRTNTDAGRRASAISRTPSPSPAVFGADAGAERSLDEVILQYLSEDGDGNRNKG